MASRVRQLQVSNLLNLTNDELNLMDARIEYYIHREKINEGEFGDRELLEELKEAYTIFRDNTQRKGRIGDFKTAVMERWRYVKVYLLSILNVVDSKGEKKA